MEQDKISACLTPNSWKLQVPQMKLLTVMIVMRCPPLGLDFLTTAKQHRQKTHLTFLQNMRFTTSLNY